MTDTPEAPAAAPRPEIATLTFADIRAALVLGWRDFRAAPQFGLFFSAVYVLGGFLMVLLSAGHVTWVLATSLGFPLAAPFAAVGLYEVSRRLEQGRALDWYRVLGVVWDERKRQVPWMGAIIVFYFLFWTFFAHMLFALIMGVSEMRSTSLQAFLTPEGLTLIAVELAVGAVAAFVLFALTVVSLPLVLDKEVDFMTAMLLSFETVTRNLAVMLAWAAVIAAISLAGLLPAFLGLMVALPLLGHATWHMYRRALIHP
ncbi:DUF2189 domain-containing protein [Salibaculum halophilum]|uniref:DUF2189 domain-containing protein n=1 Tax=Salibaculum halophilum TaxID=1914408 RepID=UPI000A0FE8B5|nr:DUF2189 domain-containing protein [Salibaculum halophilum]